MWKLIFNIVTNKGTGCNREPQGGEFSRELPPSECAWFNVTPHRYLWNGTGITERPEWAAEQAAAEAAQQQAIADLVARVALLEEAQEESGVHKYTPQQVRNYIDTQFAAATTVAQVKAVIVDVLKKIAVYSLR